MFNKSVDNILKDLLSAINNLDLLISEKTAEAERKQTKADKLVAQIIEADNEVVRAQKVKSNIQKLLEV